MSEVRTPEPPPESDNLLEELSEQLDRTRRLLTGATDEAVIEAMGEYGGESTVEAQITAEMAATATLAQPERFLDAHRLAMHALEVLDRHGFRDPRLANIGPLKKPAEQVVKFIARSIVRSYEETILRRLRKLYVQREAQSAPTSRERKALARARVDVERLMPDYRAGGGLPALLLGGAAVSLFGWVSPWLSRVNTGEATVRWIVFGVLTVLFFTLAWLLLRGSAVAHRRSRLVMQQPLAALWQTIGRCGIPPQDDSRTYATVAIGLTALIWFIVPAIAALLFFI